MKFKYVQFRQIVNDTFAIKLFLLLFLFLDKFSNYFLFEINTIFYFSPLFCSFLFVITKYNKNSLEYSRKTTNIFILLLRLCSCKYFIPQNYQRFQGIVELICLYFFFYIYSLPKKKNYKFIPQH